MSDVPEAVGSGDGGEHVAPGAAATAEAPPPPRAPQQPVPQLIEVAFKGNRREFFHWPHEGALALRTAVIVEADRGEDLGRVHATGELAERRKAGTTHGKNAPDRLRALLRVASREETARGTQLRTDEDNVRRRAIEKVRSQGLEMKISDTEWQWDKKKLTIYFTAEKRVDFRQLVRQLEGLFRTRVQMWHIGVRDEARRLDGVGRCARQYCSAGWLPELRPVKSSVAKDQRLSTLNPAQISGSCGRLMCCLRYEHEFYVQQRKRFPKEGKVLTTVMGEEKVVANDIFREQVTLRTPTGETRTVPLVALKKELGEELVASPADPAEPDEEGEREGEGDEAQSEVLVEIERAPVRAEAPSVMPAPPAEPPHEGRRRRRGRRGGRGGRRGRDGGAPGAPPGSGFPQGSGTPPAGAPPPHDAPPADG